MASRIPHFRRGTRTRRLAFLGGLAGLMLVIGAPQALAAEVQVADSILVLRAPGEQRNTIDVTPRGLAYYEYLAWLFNQGHLSVAGSRGFWTPDMIDAYDLGTTYFARSEIEDRFPELTSLKQTADAQLWPKDPCPRTPARALPVR